MNGEQGKLVASSHVISAACTIRQQAAFDFHFKGRISHNGPLLV